MLSATMAFLKQDVSEEVEKARFRQFSAAAATPLRLLGSRGLGRYRFVSLGRWATFLRSMSNPEIVRKAGSFYWPCCGANIKERIGVWLIASYAATDTCKVVMDGEIV